MVKKFINITIERTLYGIMKHELRVRKGELEEQLKETTDMMAKIVIKSDIDNLEEILSVLEPKKEK